MSIVLGFINPIWVVGLFSLFVALNSNKKLGGVLMRSSKLFRNIGGAPMEGKNHSKPDLDDEKCH